MRLFVQHWNSPKRELHILRTLGDTKNYCHSRTLLAWTLQLFRTSNQSLMSTYFYPLMSKRFSRHSLNNWKSRWQKFTGTRSQVHDHLKVHWHSPSNCKLHKLQTVFSRDYIYKAVGIYAEWKKSWKSQPQVDLPTILANFPLLGCSGCSLF